MKHHRVFKTSVAIIGASIGCATVRAQEPVESLVKPPPGSIALTPPSAPIPLEIQQRLEASQSESEQEQRRIAEESRDTMRRRRAEESADYDRRDAEFHGLREQSQAREGQQAAAVQANLAAMSQRTDYRLADAKAEHATTKAQWDAEAAYDMREFRARNEAELARRIAEGEKLGEMLVSLCFGGLGAEGGLSSILGGLGSAGAAEVGTKATGVMEGSDIAASLAGAEPIAGLASGDVEGVRRIASLVGDQEVLLDLSRRHVQSCQPVLVDPPSLDVRALRLLGYGDRSPCGASRDASGLPLSCFAPGTQDYACAVHDKALKGCKAPWIALANECVYRAHRDLASQSANLLFKGGFNFLRWLSPQNPPPASANDLIRSGIPMYPLSPDH